MYPNLSHFKDEFLLQGKWWKEKLCLQIHGIKIVYPSVENMIVVPDSKNNRDYYEYQSLSHFMNELSL